MTSLLSQLSNSWLGTALIAWVSIEALWYIIATEYLQPKINKLSTPPPSRLPPRELFRRLIHAVFVVKDVYSCAKLLEGWFGGAHIDEIYEDNVKVSAEGEAGQGGNKGEEESFPPLLSVMTTDITTAPLKHLLSLFAVYLATVFPGLGRLAPSLQQAE